MVLADRLKQFLLHLDIRKNIELDIAINYVCSWLFFDVSTLKQALKLRKTFDFSVFAANLSAVAFKRRKVDYG